MELRYHAIPRDVFDALAGGGGGPTAISVLAAAEHSKHDILLRGVLAAAQAADATQARYASVGWEVLNEANRRDRDAAARVMRYPAVGAWAVSTLSAPDTDGRAPGAVPARLAAVAAAAAVRSGLDVEVPVLPVAGVVSLPSLGAARVAADSAVVHSHPGGAEVRWPHGRVEIPLGGHPDTRGWLGIRDCRAGNLEAVIEDLDPFRMPAEAGGLAPRLTAWQARDWQRALQQGWEVLAAGQPAIAAEVAAAISVIVPLRRSVNGHLSSSSPDTFGALAMSEPQDAEACACALTHELQHVKLCAVVDIVKLTSADDGRRYYAPWRDDPRPVAGLLQGAYAHIGVTEFWRRRRQLTTGAAQLRADGQFALWRAGATRVIDTLLASDGLTLDGTDFVRRMMETARSWMGEPVSAHAQAFALREARSHLARWERRHGPVPRLA
jgi:HEXXH motif-containing protein